MNRYRMLLVLLLLTNINLVAQEKQFEWQLINKSGNTLVPAAEYIEIGTFSNGLCAVKNVRKKWGYINNQGLTVVPFMYDFAQAFTQGVAIVGVTNKQENTLYGIVDYKGREILPIKYTTVFQVHKDLFVFGNKKMGLINRTGIIVAKPEYAEILPNSYGDGLIPVRKSDAWGYVEEEGELALDFKYYQAFPFVDGKALVVKNKQAEEITLIDRTGKELLTLPYQNEKFNHKSAKLRKDGFIEVRECKSYSDNGSCDELLIGLKDIEGQEICKTEFSEIPLFKNGQTVAQKDVFLGILKDNGESITAYTYYFIFPYENGQALAKKAGDVLVKLD